MEISVALNRSQASSYLSYDRLHVLGRPVMKTLLELRNDGGAEVNRACVRAGKMIATQTRPSQEEFIGSLSRRRGKRTTCFRATAGRHSTRSLAAGARVSAEGNIDQRRVIFGR